MTSDACLICPSLSLTHLGEHITYGVANHMMVSYQSGRLEIGETSPYFFLSHYEVSGQYSPDAWQRPNLL